MIVVVAAEHADAAQAFLEARGERAFRIGRIETRPADSPQTVVV
jgi:phosphoribosylformylglycinamidine cyclo-ligase